VIATRAKARTLVGRRLLRRCDVAVGASFVCRVDAASWTVIAAERYVTTKRLVEAALRGTGRLTS
jgi:hypothetical protein